MRFVAGSAAFAQGLVLEDELTGLILVTTRTGLIPSGKGQTAGWFHDVVTVRIMALDTVHVAFDHRVAIGEAELSMLSDVTLEARFRLLAGIEDQAIERRSTASVHVQTTGTVAGFAAGIDAIRTRHRVHASVDAAREFLRNRLMTSHTGTLAHECCPLDGRWLTHHRAGADA